MSGKLSSASSRKREAGGEALSVLVGRPCRAGGTPAADQLLGFFPPAPALARVRETRRASAGTPVAASRAELSDARASPWQDEGWWFSSSSGSAPQRPPQQREQFIPVHADEQMLVASTLSDRRAPSAALWRRTNRRARRSRAATATVGAHKGGPRPSRTGRELVKGRKPQDRRISSRHSRTVDRLNRSDRRWAARRRRRDGAGGGRGRERCRKVLLGAASRGPARLHMGRGPTVLQKGELWSLPDSFKTQCIVRKSYIP